jgi:hypothetical protein
MLQPQEVLCPDKRQRRVKVETESLVPWMVLFNPAKSCKTTADYSLVSEGDVSMPR